VNSTNYYTSKQIRLNQKLWFLNKNNSIDKILFYDNFVKLSLKDLNDRSNFYLCLGNKIIQQVNTNNTIILDSEKYSLSIDVKKNDKVQLEIFFIFFDENKKIYSEKTQLCNGYNTINFDIKHNAKYLKILFRFEHQSKSEIILSNLAIDSISKPQSIQKTSIPSDKFIQINGKIDSSNIKYNEYAQYCYEEDNFRYDILTHCKKSDKLVVFFNGAVDVVKTPPPVFQRWSWFAKMPYSCMIFMDPTIYKMMEKFSDEAYIGWYQGDNSTFVLQHMVEEVKKVINMLNISSENVVFYGSSAGGFASLLASAVLKGSKACVVNPQVNVLEYHKKNVDILLSYLNINQEEALEKITLDCVKFFQVQDCFPEIYYKQNKQDTLHFEKHFKYLEKIYFDNKMQDKLHTVLTDDKRGHSAIPLFDEAFLDIEKTFDLV
jgi:hypothetical protein